MKVNPYAFAAAQHTDSREEASFWDGHVTLSNNLAIACEENLHTQQTLDEIQYFFIISFILLNPFGHGDMTDTTTSNNSDKSKRKEERERGRR